ncbi:MULTISPECIES: aldo/keto reductase [unclassified Bradyrhizobium]|uniref:aldo/keto reductase n=1 Tax=unclassified Bradyrhizobium TaxID=2631580 RepID=UPI0024784E51|nr:MULTISPECIES: aldo/keto reductase [unclassified Bradyrhizobium]WGS18563.1 aldo/keto reductase [Bradyrhizobium sp. ISRA463]WGS25387.1 aldo/keto reductase [Bradyrhizobium sp. ISRA464]
MTRRDFAALAGGFLVSTRAVAQTETPFLTRAIPGSGERIPAVGLGTAYVFDENNETTRSKADAVVQALVKNGGRLIDTASTYGDAESVLGEVTTTVDLRDRLFIATKLESPDPQELKRSLARLKMASVDLLQLHNVRSKQQSLQRFREWKKRGICRYVGITSTFHRDYPAVEAVMEREKPDFVQIDYSLDNRAAEKTILPMAAQIRAGVLTALPYGNGRLFKAVHGKELPDWARVFANSWGQFFLKYLLGDCKRSANTLAPGLD